MGSLIVTRLVRIVIVLLIVSFLTTVMVDMLPGGPAAALLGENATEEQVKALNEVHGYDDPVPVRYWNWIKNLARATSVRRSGRTQTVVADVKQRFPVTFELAIGAQVIALLVAVTLALMAAPRAGQAVDRLATTGMSALVAVPSFIGAFLPRLHLRRQAPMGGVVGWVPLTEDVGANLSHAILPMAALGVARGRRLPAHPAQRRAGDPAGGLHRRGPGEGAAVTKDHAAARVAAVVVLPRHPRRRELRAG